MHVAGADLGLKEYTLYPIKHVGIEGFSRDPFGGITSELVGSRKDGEPPADVLMQVVFRPAPESWWKGINGGASTIDIAEGLNSPSYHWERRLFTFYRAEDPPSQKQKNAAKIVRDMENEHGWELNIRVFVVSASPEVAIRRARGASGMFRNYFESKTGQKFVAQPLTGSALRTELTRVANRELVDKGITKSESEVAGLIHVPNSEINQQDVQWALSRAGHGVPPGTPRFEFENAGVAMGTDNEKLAAMSTSAERGAPYWFGMGSRNGIEAGVEEDVFTTHGFVGGASGYGKTTFSKNLFKQVVDRGYGCLFYDPKGMDAEEFAALVSEDREDDLVFIELGSSREHQVGFNFLEVPGTAEPGTPEHSAALESMADDLESILPLASGVNEGSWGTRMSRIARNIARGLGKLDREVTLYDAHLIASEAAGREAYASALEEEEINFIKDYAINHLAEMDDDAIEPFAGRLQQLIENHTVLDIVTIKDGISIDEVVEDGKIVIVQDNDSSNTTGKMVATTLIRRLWVSVREQTYDDTRPDPEQFYAILDEFNEIATVNSDVADIFAEARSFGLSLITLTQDLSSQLDDEIMEAVEGQAETFISFNPGRKGDAKIIESQHSSDMGYEDLLELPKYRFLMRTHDEDGELTHSYKVNATPPIEEISDVPRPPEETTALIDRRIAAVGNKRRTDEEIMNDTALVSAIESGVDPEAPSEEGDDEQADITTDPAEQVLYESIYTIQIRRDAVGDFVPNEVVIDEWRRRVGDLGFSSEVSNVIEQAPEEHLKSERQDGTPSMLLTRKGRQYAGLEQDTGSGASGGGDEHRWVLSEAHRAFTKLGMRVRLPTQDEDGELPDGVADLPIDPMDGEDVHEIHALEERLKEEYPYLYEFTDEKNVSIEAETSTLKKPMQTLTNLRKAVNAHRLCVFACKSETAERDLFEYWPRRGEGIIYNSSGRGSNRTVNYDQLILAKDVDGHSHRTFYNKNAVLEIEDEIFALRERDGEDLEWREEDGSLVMGGGRGSEYARLPSVETVADPDRSDVPAYYTRDDETKEYIVRASGEKLTYATKDEMLAEWIVVREPFIPDNEFDRLPTPEDFVFVVFPDADDEYNEPTICEGGETRPLLPEGIEWETTEKSEPGDESKSEAEAERMDAGRDVESEDAAPVHDPKSESAVATASDGGSEGPSETKQNSTEEDTTESASTDDSDGDGDPNTGSEDDGDKSEEEKERGFSSL